MGYLTFSEGVFPPLGPIFTGKYERKARSHCIQRGIWRNLVIESLMKHLLSTSTMESGVYKIEGPLHLFFHQAR